MLEDLLKEEWYLILRQDGRGLHSLLKTVANLSEQTLHEEDRAETWEAVLLCRGRKRAYDDLKRVIESDVRESNELAERRAARRR